jgi:hypothetical protein
MLCSGCGAENPAGQKFCNRCGASLNRHCPKSRFDNPPDSKFCGQCGASLAPAELQPITPPRAADPAMRISSECSTPPLEGGRKTVTALFADIKSSAELE